MIVEYAFECLAASLRAFIVGARQEQSEVKGLTYRTPISGNSESCDNMIKDQRIPVVYFKN